MVWVGYYKLDPNHNATTYNLSKQFNIQLIKQNQLVKQLHMIFLEHFLYLISNNITTQNRLLAILIMMPIKIGMADYKEITSWIGPCHLAELK